LSSDSSAITRLSAVENRSSSLRFSSQSLAFAGLLSKSCLEVNDLRASCSNIDGDLCFRGFERSKQVLRRRKLLTQRLTFFFRKFGLFLELSNFVAQLA
jgi:hypothetical protein